MVDNLEIQGVGSWRDTPEYRARQEVLQRERAERLVDDQKHLAASRIAKDSHEQLADLAYRLLKELLPGVEHHRRGGDLTKMDITQPSDDPRLLLNNDDFLLRVRRELPTPCRIYYPGCGKDTKLEVAFDKKEIYYLDLRDDLDTAGRRFYQSDYRQAPFKKGFFNALFYNDCHAPLDVFEIMLRSLKVGGLVIYNIDGCKDEVDTETMKAIPQLRMANLPFCHINYWVLEKIIPV